MANANIHGLSVKWSRSQVEAEKAAVKSALERIAATGDAAARLAYLTQSIRELEDDHAPAGQLKRFVCIISALVHHERHGGLGEREVKSLAKIAEAILRTQGIQAKSSRLAFMHGELHLILSQIFRKSGQQWRAAWEQQLGFYSARADPSGGKGFQALAMANRALRLGNGPTALRLFTIAEAAGPSPAQLAQCRLGRVLTLRLMGDLVGSAALAEATSASPLIGEPVRRELEWERCIRAVQESGALDQMMERVQAGGTHREAGYLVDAALFAKVVARREWLDAAPKARYMARRKELRPQRFGHLYDCLLQLDDCYDLEIPMPIRLAGLGEILRRTQRLISVNSELLVWGAAVRWLGRSQVSAVAALVFDEYQALSLRLSGGRSGDALGLLGDITGRDWLAELEQKQAG